MGMGRLNNVPKTVLPCCTTAVTVMLQDSFTIISFEIQCKRHICIHISIVQKMNIECRLYMQVNRFGGCFLFRIAF